MGWIDMDIDGGGGPDRYDQMGITGEYYICKECGDHNFLGRYCARCDSGFVHSFKRRLFWHFLLLMVLGNVALWVLPPPQSWFIWGGCFSIYIFWMLKGSDWYMRTRFELDNKRIFEDRLAGRILKIDGHQKSDPIRNSKNN